MANELLLLRLGFLLRKAKIEIRKITIILIIIILNIFGSWSIVVSGCIVTVFVMVWLIKPSSIILRVTWYVPGF